MDKGRVAAFTDAVVAIVLTIMVLEFKTPEEPTFAALASEWSYFVAYLISFLFIGVAWYNHHYMFALTKRVTKGVYWVNNLWILVMAMLPVSTAWAGRFIMAVLLHYLHAVDLGIRRLVLCRDAGQSKQASRDCGEDSADASLSNSRHRVVLVSLADCIRLNLCLATNLVGLHLGGTYLDGTTDITRQ
ncbi:hypothetical protein IV54_GL002135 [Levilactobacillus paucivorans]|uniref:Integral membrane protein n=1 Tax=Levilactobacillus paucivorans TaxID=616990 RepID=A0A0R2LZJ5_9LACO|nr:TMEM175 family protein [Levilactobacillus paucivorans]KRO03674.1 hypothetical protein IV54_GL002135 [Levilactobacillus paucivorans]